MSSGEYTDYVQLNRSSRAERIQHRKAGLLYDLLLVGLFVLYRDRGTMLTVDVNERNDKEGVPPCEIF